MINLNLKPQLCASHIISAARILTLLSIAALFLCFSTEAKANDTIHFELSDFRVIDTLVHSNFSPKSSFLWYGPGTNRFRLTDTVPTQTVAMWHVGNTNGVTLDMSKEWVFNFTLHFGNGTVGRGIADGVVLIMTTSPVSDSLIGGGNEFIGYAAGASRSGIPNSFAIPPVDKSPV